MKSQCGGHIKYCGGHKYLQINGRSSIKNVFYAAWGTNSAKLMPCTGD
jgi:hypothetical protein